MAIQLIPASVAHLDAPPPALQRGLLAGYPSAEDGVTELAAIFAIMGAVARPSPWADWWALAENGTIAGLCGFKAPPDADGVVEIAYGSFPRWEGRGVATGMAAGLVAIAAANGACMVNAHTLAPDNASATVLRRNGFNLLGTAIDPEDGEVWAWQRPLTPPAGAPPAARDR